MKEEEKNSAHTKVEKRTQKRRNTLRITFSVSQTNGTQTGVNRNEIEKNLELFSKDCLPFYSFAFEFRSIA